MKKYKLIIQILLPFLLCFAFSAWVLKLFQSFYFLGGNHLTFVIGFGVPTIFALLVYRFWGRTCPANWLYFSYASQFITVFALNNLGFYILSFILVWPKVACIFMCCSVTLWTLHFLKHPYLVKLDFLKSDKMTLISLCLGAKPYILIGGQILLLIFALMGGTFMLFGFGVLVLKLLPLFDITYQNLSISLNILYAFLLLSLVVGGIYFFKVVNKWFSITRFQALTPNKPGDSSLFFWGYGLTRIKLFFLTCPAAKKNPFIIFLAALSFLRYFYPLFFGLGGLSLRFDSGFSLAILLQVYFLTSFVVTIPEVYNYMSKVYGQKTLRMLGWNTFFATCITCGRRAVYLAVTYNVAAFAHENLSTLRTSGSNILANEAKTTEMRQYNKGVDRLNRESGTNLYKYAAQEPPKGGSISKPK